jgi:hypothetical protein
VTHSPLALHTAGETQSLTEEHDVIHAPVPCSQMYGAQSVMPPSPATDVFCEVWLSMHFEPPGMHLPPLHTKSCTQSELPEQIVLQLEPPQRRLPGQGAAGSVLQVPAPSHSRGVASLPEHVEPQSVLALG